MTHKLLARQLKRYLHVDDINQLAALMRELEMGSDNLSPEVRATLAGFEQFIELVSNQYSQYERDLALSHHMMAVSSQELTDANEKLLDEVINHEKALETLAHTANNLLEPLGRSIKIDGNNLEDLTNLLTELVKDLNDSREQLQMTLQNAPDAVFITEQNGHMVYVNDNTVELLGYVREELYTMSVFDLVPENWRDAYKQGAKKMLTAQMKPVMEIRLITKSGKKIPLEMNAALLPNGHVYGSCRDISKRKKLDEDLRIMAATFDVQEAIMITDQNGNILRANRSFESMTGYQSSELLGKNPSILKSDQHDDAYFEDMRAKLTEDGKWSGEIWNKRKNGEVFPQYMTITAVYDQYKKVTHYVSVSRDITQRKRREQEIHQLAFYDPLTKLPNRRLFMDRLQRAIATGERNNTHGALIFMDLDNFKTINDTQGHEMGDQLLIEAAHRLLLCVREGDTVARLGGDEFVIALQDMSKVADEAASQAKLVAEKIQYELGRSYELNQFECICTASIGIVIFRGHQETFDALLKNADTAMYQAKAAGRNTIRFFDPAMQAALELRINMESELRQALNNDQFQLYYQIQVDYLHRPMGAEVLLRWEHPKHGIVSPAQFIDLAEETGLIAPIGLWVLKTACEQLCAWQAEALTRNLTLSVNVSAKQFHQTDFVSQIQNVLHETGAKPALLKLELTESTTLSNIDDTVEKMHDLKQLGIGFSMDDFGTGYSSLQYLKSLPLDQIKIDQTFVRDITTDPNDAAIVKTIIAMTNMLGLSVIAEGVETEAQLDFLNQNGCHTFQGYLFSRPVTIKAFEQSLQNEQ